MRAKWQCLVCFHGTRVNWHLVGSAKLSPDTKMSLCPLCSEKGPVAMAYLQNPKLRWFLQNQEIKINFLWSQMPWKCPAGDSSSRKDLVFSCKGHLLPIAQFQPLFQQAVVDLMLSKRNSSLAGQVEIPKPLRTSLINMPGPRPINTKIS